MPSGRGFLFTCLLIMEALESQELVFLPPSGRQSDQFAFQLVSTIRAYQRLLARLWACIGVYWRLLARLSVSISVYQRLSVPICVYSCVSTSIRVCPPPSASISIYWRLSAFIYIYIYIYNICASNGIYWRPSASSICLLLSASWPTNYMPMDAD